MLQDSVQRHTRLRYLGEGLQVRRGRTSIDDHRRWTSRCPLICVLLLQVLKNSNIDYSIPRWVLSMCRLGPL